jgi:hypothetical protein
MEIMIEAILKGTFNAYEIDVLDTGIAISLNERRYYN